MFLVCPAAIGRGKNVFQGVEDEVRLQLVDTKVFGSGCVMLRYRPANQA